VPPIAGRATINGTESYAARFKDKLNPAHFVTRYEHQFSTLGIGTYLGEADDATDAGYRDSLARAAHLGCNVFDTAINYRCQRSERALGAALKTLIEQDQFKREEFIVATKAGFIPFDQDVPKDPARFVAEHYINTGIIEAGDLVQGCHVLSAKYLEDQLERSLKNLGVETIDIFYVHNPETQLAELENKAFMAKLGEAFEYLERAVKQGKIACYGTATWNGYRVRPEDSGYLSLEEICVKAREVGGSENHFRAIQVPYNMAMPEAFSVTNQSVGANWHSLLEVCQRYQLIVMTSASLMQGALSRNLPQQIVDFFPGAKADAERALQFVRSTPGVTSALVGMKTPEHVTQNMRAAQLAPLEADEFLKIFTTA